MYNLEVSPDALKSLERLKKSGAPVLRRIVNSIESLRNNPLAGKKLLGPLSDFRSLRVGEYRILYIILEKRVLIQVVKIAHRREVYG